MIFSVFNDGFKFFLDFGPDSFTPSVKDLVQEMTISSQGNPLAAWSFLLSQRQDFVKNHQESAPITPNPGGTREMMDEVLSSLGAQDMDPRGYQALELDDVDFKLENYQLVTAFIPGVDTLFSPSTFNTFDMGSVSKNPILIDEKQDNEISPPPHPTTRLRETNPSPCVDERLPIRNKN